MAVSMTSLTALLPVCSQEGLAVATGERAIDVVARCQKAFGLLAQMTEIVSVPSPAPDGDCCSVFPFLS
jgi:hypothetical protein